MPQYKQHVQKLQRTWESALAETEFESALVFAGSAAKYFEDDQSPAFRLNPHLAHWMPDCDLQNSALAIEPGKRAKLFLYRPDDFWHATTPLPDDVQNCFNVEIFKKLDDLEAATKNWQGGTNRNACIGEPSESYSHPGSNLPQSELNPPALIATLHYQRAYKSDYEVECLRIASEKSAKGHIAAAQAFDSGASEFDIHMAYLAASQQLETELPYGNIVALNTHAAILHYQHYDREAPVQAHSFLIDAGARHRGYASDITRTYCTQNRSNLAYAEQFEALIRALDARQQKLVSHIKAGMNYYDLHVKMHRHIADVLVESEIVNCSAEQAFDYKITDVFFPHGLGHFLGLQTHDVGGWLGASAEFANNPPERFPTLRLTRDVEAGQVFTIEPGIYFIPMLLNAYKINEYSAAINWNVVEQFLPFGGIRIEDNILVGETACENFTRNAFAGL